MMTQNVLMWQPLAHVGTCLQFYAIINFTDIPRKKNGKRQWKGLAWYGNCFFYNE